MKQIKICPYCKTTFTTEKNARKFCRKKCALLHRRKMAKINSKHLCQRCGHIFTAPRKRKFCTKECHSTYMRELGLIRKTTKKIPVKITLIEADRKSKAEGISYGTFVSLHKLK